ncbi:MAG: hypothetical protein MI807_15710 [Verrucomicrobiales bacterium]|nr:hypothetical protein [Verrucomicrobiales bacterium]
MTPTCQIGLTLFAQTSLPNLPEPLLRWAESLTLPTYLAMGAVALLSFLIGRAAARKRSRKGASSVDSPGSKPDAELLWRHEKLVLLERQDQEKQNRLVGAIDDAFQSKDSRAAEIRMRLFRISETLRDIRQRVGSDHSRLTLLQDRLEFLREEGAPRIEAVNGSLEIATSHVERLTAVREKLRPVAATFLELEEGYSGEECLTTGKATFRDSLLAARKRLEDLPSDWQILTDEADRKIRDLLQGDDSTFDSIRNILLIDGSVTASLEESDDSNLRDDVDAILALLEKKTSFPRTTGNPFDAPAESDTSVPPSPDSGFRAPASFAGGGNGSSRSEQKPEPEAEPETLLNRADEEATGSEPEDARPPMVVFRSNNPGLWGKDIYRGADARAREIETLPEWAEWVSISRLDTGETVYAPASTLGFSNEQFTGSTGFNATYELFYGARHLGMFSETVPNEVETRFTYGGWGFGHRVAENGDDSVSPQASGWAGKEIPSDTVFEILLHETLPETSDSDLVLAVAEEVPAG